MTVLLGGGLLIKPALAISQLAIDVDKSWQGPTVIHSPAWAPTLVGWQDRKKITVAGSVAGLLTNYQMCLTVHYGAGVDGGSDVYLNEKCSGDFGDLRFTNNAGTPLSYFIDSYTTGVSAKVWIKFDSIPASPATADFWLYSNCSAGLSASNGLGTFIVFNAGNTLVGWTDVTVVGAGNIDWTIVASKIRGTASANNAAAFFYSNVVSGIDSYKMHVHILAQDGLTASDYRQGMVHKLAQDNVDKAKAYWKDSTNTWIIEDEGAGTDSSVADATFDATLDHEYILRRTPTQSDLSIDSLLKVTHLKAGWSPQTIGLYARLAATAHWADFYNIFVAKYASPEPTFSSFGADEPYEIFYGITSLKELAAAMIKGDIFFSDGVTLARRASGPIGSILTTHDVGADPTWTYPP